MRLPKKACSNNTLFFQQCRIFLKIHPFFPFALSGHIYLVFQGSFTAF